MRCDFSENARIALHFFSSRLAPDHEHHARDSVLAPHSLAAGVVCCHLFKVISMSLLMRFGTWFFGRDDNTSCQLLAASGCGRSPGTLRFNCSCSCSCMDDRPTFAGLRRSVRLHLHPSHLLSLLSLPSFSSHVFLVVPFLVDGFHYVFWWCFFCFL